MSKCSRVFTLIVGMFVIVKSVNGQEISEEFFLSSIPPKNQPGYIKKLKPLHYTNEGLFSEIKNKSEEAYR